MMIYTYEKTLISNFEFVLLLLYLSLPRNLAITSCTNINLNNYEVNRYIHDLFSLSKIGDILTFDNTRCLHGRTGYTDEDNNTRHLIGAYLDWDEIYSRLRVLTLAKQKSTFPQHLYWDDSFGLRNNIQRQAIKQ